MGRWEARHTWQVAAVATIVFGALLLAGAPGYLFFLLTFALYALLVAELRLREAQRVRGLPVRGRLPGRAEYSIAILVLLLLSVGAFFGVRASAAVVFAAYLLRVSTAEADLRSRWRREDQRAAAERRRREIEAEVVEAGERGISRSEWGVLDRRQRIAKLLGAEKNRGDSNARRDRRRSR